MMRSIAFVITLGLSAWACAKHSSAVDISQSTRESIGTSLLIIEENGAPLTLAEVRQQYEQHAYDVHTNDVLSRGINAPAIWLITEFHNPTLFPLSKRLVVDTTWLDQLDIYITHAKAPTAHHRLGDNLPFEQRPISSRHFALDYDFGPGTTRVYLRIDTPDPMTLPIYLMDIDDYIGQERRDGYLHGFIYGVVIALMLYNLILAIRLLNPINLYYSVFMLAFLAMNLAYTGHGYAWLWGDYPNIQRWAVPFFMGCYMVWGLCFGVRFLNLKQHIPWLHRSILFSIAVIASSLLLLIAIGAQGLAIHFAFAYMMIFAAGTLVLGAIATSRKLPSANYFLAATLLGVTGALITTLTVWGIISYHPLGYLAVDIGMALEAVLLSLALAHQFNQIKNEKLQAERLARIDPLTGLTNRRAFDELANPIWSNAERNHRNLSLIMIDIDHFKMINDEFGHPVGDKVIQEVATQLKQQCRAGDILARWGGEEFLLLLPETSLQQANQMAERYRNLVLDIRFSEGDIQIKPTASFGVATKDDYNDSLRRVITSADNLLYVAKQTGRNRVCAQKPVEESGTVEPEQLSLHQEA